MNVSIYLPVQPFLTGASCRVLIIFIFSGCLNIGYILVLFHFIHYPFRSFTIQTDVIVNTASPDRNLRSGKISAALLEKAGHGMQKEIYDAKQTAKYFIVTSHHRLHCKAVYHTCCPFNNTNAPQVQYEFNCTSSKRLN